jgi:hypothetical protein
MFVESVNQPDHPKVPEQKQGQDGEANRFGNSVPEAFIGFGRPNGTKGWGRCGWPA